MLNFTELYNRFPEEIRTSLENQMQNPKWHPEGSVYNHIKLVFEDVQEMYPDDTDLALVALFHDLGKIDTSTIKEKDGNKFIISYNHEYFASKYIDKYIHLFNDLNPNVERIKSICLQHMKAHLYVNGKIKKKYKLELFENDKYFNDVLKFEKADSNRQGNDTE